jgi:hypothetical protein
MAVQIKTYPDPTGNKFTIAATVDQEMMAEASAMMLIERIMHLVAERYVEENYPALVAKLDQQAIANLAVADAGKKIAEEIRTKPTVLHDTKTEVYQRGIFGTLRRL